MNFRLFIASMLWLTAILSASALSVELPVTPDNQANYPYSFTVSTNAVSNGTAFHIVVTNKTDSISSDCSAGLSIVTHTENSSSIMGLEPPLAIKLKKSDRVWEADFVVPPEILQKPGLRFVFTALEHASIQGKHVPMPSATFYELKLDDFIHR